MDTSLSVLAHREGESYHLLYSAVSSYPCMCIPSTRNVALAISVVVIADALIVPAIY